MWFFADKQNIVKMASLRRLARSSPNSFSEPNCSSISDRDGTQSASIRTRILVGYNTYTHLDPIIARRPRVSDAAVDPANLPPAEKVKTFPTTPGVYLMKDADGKVIYVGKAKNLRSRAGSLLHRPGRRGPAHSDLVKLIADIDFIPTDTEVDALLREARLVKDIRPRFNTDLKDDKTFPVPADPHPRGVPARRVHPQAAPPGGQALWPVHQRPQPAGGDPGAPARLPVPHLLARHSLGRRPLALVPAVPAAQHPPVHRPVQLPRQPGGLPQADPLAAPGPRRQERPPHPRDDRRDAAGERQPCSSRRRPRSATTWPPCRSSNSAATWTRTSSPRSSTSTPRRGCSGLKKVLGLRGGAAVDRGDGHRPPGRRRTPSPRWSASSTACRSNRATGDSRSRRSKGWTTSPRCAKSSAGGSRTATATSGARPDILLIDGGKGQLNAAVDAFRSLGIEPPTLISLAKQEEEIFRPGESEPIKLSRHSAALRLLQFVRDEAHRFAQHYHHTLRKRRLRDEME